MLIFRQALGIVMDVPTYVFECRKCKKVDEKFLSIKSSPKRRLVCPACKKLTMVRQIGSGSGFTGAKPFVPFEAWTLGAKPEYAYRTGPDGRKQRRITKLNFPKVETKQQMREIAAGSWNGERCEINAL